MPSPRQTVLGVVDQRHQLVHRRLGPHELDHLHLVELVAALDAAHVAPGAHLLAPEAGRVGDVLDRQLLAVQDLVAVQVGHRHLGRRDPPEILLGIVVQVVAELGQVAGADQDLRA